MKARVELRVGEKTLRVILLDQEVTTLGRAPDRDVQVSDIAVARVHAELRASPSGYLITDLGSGKETLLDGEPLRPHQPVLLRDGAVVLIGAHELVYHVELDPPAPPRRDDREAPTGRYLRYLPGVYQDQDFFKRFLMIFEALWEPHERRQDHIERYLDPRTAPSEMLPWLASWSGLNLPAELPEGRVRMVLAEAVDLCRWRGTLYGLERLLELATGECVGVKEDTERPHVVRIQAPQGVDRGAVEALVRANKPAYIAYQIEGVD